jgi:signal transduction histidine kinase/CheY-like chemotaxis protein
VATVVLVLLGLALVGWGDRLTDPSETSKFYICALISFGCSVGLWLLDKWRPRVGRWSAVVALVAVVHLGYHWLGIPGFLVLTVLPVTLSAAVVGPPATVVTAIAETTVLLASPGRPALRESLAPFLPLIAIWAIAGLTYVAYYPIRRREEWLWDYFCHAQRTLEKVQDQRMEFKQVQEDLLHANQELARLSDRLNVMYQRSEEARRTKEEFAANVSHELRTPLNMIIGFSEMIPKLSGVYGTKLPPVLLSDIAAIRRNAQHLAKLVDDVLDLSQIEAGRMALSKEWTSLQSVIGEAVEAVRTLFESKGLYLETNAPSNLPQVLCDRTRVRQVVLNLLSNAGRFMEHGGVEVSAWHKGDECVVSVRDTGPGIALEDQRKLFQPFQQVDSSIRRRSGGSGLGLSISRQFVEMHEGKMWVESELGVGTTFFFSLPLEISLTSALTGDDPGRWFSAYNEYEYRQRTRRSKAPVPTLVPRYVLLEEGNGLQRLFSRYMNGAEVAVVPGIEQASRELSRSPAQALVINTLPLEGMSGLKEHLSDLPYGTPAMACWVPGADEAARRFGIVRYLVKPVALEALLSALNDLGEDIETVLLVDDDPEALQLFVRMLSSAPQHYRILQAKNGRRALALLRQRQPDVVLLDLIMPDPDGFQVLQEKNQDPSIQDIPVIVLSSRDPSGDPIVSNMLAVTRGGGLSMPDLLACIQALSDVLAPSARADRPARPGTSAE